MNGTPLGHKILLSLAVLPLLLGAGCTRSSSENPTGPETAVPSATPTDLEAETIRDVATNFEAPWSIAFFGEVPILSERDSGRIFELVASGQGSYEKRHIATLDEVSHGGEGGLLGLAVRENYLYAYFTSSRDNRIERYVLRGEPGSFSLGRAESVLKGIPKSGTHNGGRIAFGPDTKLYATTGDAGDPSSSQSRASLAGKILRLEPDGAIPTDNPFKGSPVFSYGHRNPQGIAWGPDGTMYASEFGQNTWDELNVIKPGANYGWPTVEGIAKRRGFVDPVQQWDPSEASPSGIAVVGESIFIANLRGQRLREVPLADLSVATEHFVGEFGRIRDTVAAPDGSLWFLTNTTDGRGDPRDGDDRVVRLDPNGLGD